jgi:OPA family sugar phosphate sensor protein UhpC-like MFS transporter
MNALLGSLGTTLGGPFLLYFVGEGEWRNAFLAAGGTAALVSVMLFFFLYDSPSLVNLTVPWNLPATTTPAPSTTDTTSVKKNDNAPSAPSVSDFYKVVIWRSSFWMLLLGDLLIYFILRLCSEWLLLLLFRHAEYSIEVSSSALVFYEGGGVVGTLLSGPLSDILGGKRNFTSLLYCLLLTVSIPALSLVDKQSPIVYVNMCVFLIGFGVNGPKTLAGIAVREMHTEAAGTAGGALGMAGQVGGTELSSILSKTLT